MSLLAEGEVEVLGRMPWSSNATFLTSVCLGDATTRAIYKPHRGERPLWDFPDGLYRREVAAYALSEALGWGLVPETVVRDGPLGVGSLQRFVDADFSEQYFTLVERPEHQGVLRAVAAFDLVANNADRKGGHCLLGLDGRVYGIDHGLCFHADPRLRTVVWDFVHEPIPENLLADLARLAVDPPANLSGLLSEREIDKLAARAKAVVRRGTYPDPGPSRRPYPWPLV